MMNKPYYYGQGRISLANLSDENKNWYFIGDASDFSLDVQFDEKQKKASIGGRLVTSKRYVSAINASVNITWHNLDADNLKLLFNATRSSHRQSWRTEQFYNVKSGDVIALMYHNVRRIEVQGLQENIHYKADALFGSIEFLITPPEQPVIVSYDFPEEDSLELLNDEPQEFALRFDGINLADNGAATFVELYRLSLDPAVTLELINSGTTISALQTTAQLLPDFTKLDNSDIGIFGRFVTNSEFKLITYNSAINYDGTYEHVY